MPKPQKMHPRGRAVPSALHKPDGTSSGASGGNDGGSGDDSARNFELELCWCIQQLERVLAEKKLSEKQLQETWKVATVLKNNAQPVVRKRQLMRTHFGDYRAKMAQQEKKLVKMANAIKMTDTPANPKAKFIRRSAFLTTGDESFRFNFELSPEQQDSTEAKRNEPASTDDGENSDSAKNDKPFKFSFSNSPFKFNFKENDA